MDGKGDEDGDEIIAGEGVGFNGVEVVDGCAAPFPVGAEFCPSASLSCLLVVGIRLNTCFAVPSSSDGVGEGTCMPTERTLGRLAFDFDVLAFRLPLPLPEVDRAEAFLEADVGVSTPIAGSGGDASVVKVWSGEDGTATDGDEALADAGRDDPFRFFALMVDSSALLVRVLLLSPSTGMRASGGKRLDQV